jgi:hypothetical protein
MTDTSAPTLFTRVTGMGAAFIDWIGGGEPLAIPPAFYRKAQPHLCVIKDMLRGALYIAALDITLAPIVPKPVACVRVTRKTRPPLPGKTTLPVQYLPCRRSRAADAVHRPAQRVPARTRRQDWPHNRCLAPPHRRHRGGHGGS